MGLAVALVAGTVSLDGALTHDTLTDNQGWLALGNLGDIQCAANLLHVVTVDFDHIPAPGTILGCSIFCSYHLTLGRKLDIVGIVEHDEVIQAQSAGNTACALRNLLLDATVGNISVDLVIHHLLAQQSSQMLLSNGSTDSVSVTLT